MVTIAPASHSAFGVQAVALRGPEAGGTRCQRGVRGWIVIAPILTSESRARLPDPGTGTGTGTGARAIQAQAQPAGLRRMRA